MSINSMIDSTVHCLKCGKLGYRTCDCWEQCSCGLTIERGAKCRHPVHGPIGKQYRRDGYWVLDGTGRPYKTGTGSIQWLRKRMDKGTVWGSRKEANAAIRAAKQKLE